MNDRKNIIFTQAAHSAYNTLNEKEQQKAIGLLEMVAQNDQYDIHSEIYKLAGTEQSLFAIKLNLKLRIIIEIGEDELTVLDILNHDLFVKYFKNRKG